MDIDVGQVVAGKYELVRLLGRGSMGQVWVAHHRTLEEQLAVKFLNPNPSAEEELEDPATASARFLFEAQVAARLSRKTRHIVRVTDHGEDQGVAYLVMELLEGETLEGVLVRERRLEPARVAAIVTQIARALALAHAEGVVHRDLKPANVFLTRDEEGHLLVKLLDFGIARALHIHRVRSAFSTAKGLVFGTPGYMSPEQARCSPNLDHQCDLWALATIAFEALTGELPVDAADTDETLHKLMAGRVMRLRDRAPELPAALDAVFERAFDEWSRGRFASATELAKAIEDAVPRSSPPVAIAPVAITRPPVRSAALLAPVVPPPRDLSFALAPVPVTPVAPAPDDARQEAADRRALDRRRRARVGLAALLAGLVVIVGGGIVWRTWARAASTPVDRPVSAPAVAR